MESGQDFRHLGEQTGQSGRYLLELGHGVGGLGLGELVPAGVPLRRARQPGHDHPVGVGARTILFHLNSIEHVYDTSKLSIRPVFCGLRAAVRRSSRRDRRLPADRNTLSPEFALAADLLPRGCPVQRQKRGRCHLAFLLTLKRWAALPQAIRGQAGRVTRTPVK